MGNSKFKSHPFLGFMKNCQTTLTKCFNCKSTELLANKKTRRRTICTITSGN